MALVVNIRRNLTFWKIFFAFLVVAMMAACGSLDNSDLPGNLEDEDLGAGKKISEINIPDQNLKSCIEDQEIEYVFELQTLTCANAGISDLTGLENFTGLTDLSLFGNQINDISALADLIKLKNLSLQWNKQISDIGPLSELVSLESLYLSDNAIEILDPLAGHINLIYLHLSQNSGIEDLEPLASLKNLEILGLYGNETITEISSLQNLTHLQYLYLSYNDITDISDLANLTELIFLSLDNNTITAACPLENLINLNGLHLHNNQITDTVSCLQGMNKILAADGWRLDLSGNVDVSGDGLIKCDEIEDLELALPNDRVIPPDNCIP